MLSEEVMISSSYAILTWEKIVYRCRFNSKIHNLTKAEKCKKCYSLEDNSRKLVKTNAEMAKLGKRTALKMLYSARGLRVRLPFSVQNPRFRIRGGYP